MKFRRRNGSAARDDVFINLASLIDVIFVLLLFFVVTTTFSRPTQLKVELPEAVSGTPPEATDIKPLELDIDAAGHYARLSPVLNIFQLSGSSPNQDLIPRSSFNNRLQGVQTTTNRCPGSAAQATSDGSAPFTDGGAVSCNTSDVPPNNP